MIVATGLKLQCLCDLKKSGKYFLITFCMEHLSGNSSVHIHEVCGIMTTVYTGHRFKVHIDRCPKVKKICNVLYQGSERTCSKILMTSLTILSLTCW